MALDVLVVMIYVWLTTVAKRMTFSVSTTSKRCVFLAQQLYACIEVLAAPFKRTAAC